MQINWHVFSPPNITESHVSQAPTSHTIVSNILHALEWVLPLEKMVVGLICVDPSITAVIARFLESYLHTSNIVVLINPCDFDRLSDGLPIGDRIAQIVFSDSENPPIKSGGLDVLVIVGLSNRVSLDLHSALELVSRRLVLVTHPLQYANTLSTQLDPHRYGVGYVDREWLLVLVEKGNHVS